MKHFLITRFNLRTENWTTAKDGSPVLTKEWLENRFHLFETYCLPSVINQTEQDFTWLVFFDTQTPQEYKKKVKEISEQYKNFSPVFIDGIDQLNNSLLEEIKKKVVSNDEYIITSRLDNDDIIHKDFIKTIQSLFQPKDKTVIDLRKGYQITLGKPFTQIREVYNVFNPYISLIESADGFKTVFHKQHKEWKHSDSVITYEKMRMWGEVVHKENMLNSTLKFTKRSYSLNPKEFGQEGNNDTFKDSAINVFLANKQLSIRRTISKFKN